jgi:hypothetical protein
MMRPSAPSVDSLEHRVGHVGGGTLVSTGGRVRGRAYSSEGALPDPLDNPVGSANSGGVGILILTSG